MSLSTLNHPVAWIVFLAIAASPISGVAQAPNHSEYYMEFSNAKTHVPAGAPQGNKTARMTVRITITNRGGPPAGLAGVRFELCDHTGKIIPAARIVAGPVRPLQELFKPGQAVIEFDAAVYDFAPEPGERYKMNGRFPQGRVFGRVVRFEQSSDPLPVEPWEKQPSGKTGKAKPRAK